MSKCSTRTKFSKNDKLDWKLLYYHDDFRIALNNELYLEYLLMHNIDWIELEINGFDLDFGFGFVLTLLSQYIAQTHKPQNLI